MSASFRCTDAGNAKRFASQHQGAAIFVPAVGWRVWDGTRYALDDMGAAERLAKQTAAAIFTEAAASGNDDERRAVARWALASERGSALREMIRLAESEPDMAAAPDSFDTDPWLFNCRNGTLDLRTGALRPHRKEDRLTRVAPVEYNPDATSPVWDAFLERVQPDPQTRAFLRRAAGYTLTGTTREEVLFFVHGDGANGKTRFLEALANAIGPDYARTADFSLFTAGKNEGPRNDIARLAGVRYVKSSEVDDGRRLAEALIKTLTGGDRVSARFLFREAFEFEPAFKPWLAANYRPEIRGADHGIWRRILLIPFSVRIPEAERDKELAAKLRDAAPAVLRWAVAGCLEWGSDGLRPPNAVVAATEAYREESDTVGRFLAECCKLEPTAVTSAGSLYNAYRTYTGTASLSATAFGKELTRRNFDSIKSGTVRRIGIRLLPDSSDSSDSFPEGSSNAHTRERN